MSYILDALKRAERERKQGQISVLDELPAAVAPGPAAHGGSRRRLVAALLAALVLGMAGTYVLLSWKHHGKRVPPVATAPAEPVVATPPPTPIAQVPAAPATPPPVPPQAQTQAAPPPAATPPASAPAPTPATPPQAQLADNGKMATLGDLSEEAPPAAPPGRPEHAPRPAGAAPPAPAAASGPTPVEAPAADTTPAEPQPAEVPPPAPPAPGGAQQLKQMPESYRAQFPQFSVDVLAYDRDPRRRFVLVNGKQYKEGDSLAEGPTIVSILANGIVFDWQGQRVLYATSR